MGRLINLADDSGWFKKIIGALFIVIGLAIVLGYDKVFEEAVLDSGALDGIIQIENQLLEENLDI